MTTNDQSQHDADRLDRLERNQKAMSRSLQRIERGIFEIGERLDNLDTRLTVIDAGVFKDLPEEATENSSSQELLDRDRENRRQNLEERLAELDG